jgi:hypothetical protein
MKKRHMQTQTNKQINDRIHKEETIVSWAIGQTVQRQVKQDEEWICLKSEYKTINKEEIAAQLDLKVRLKKTYKPGSWF